jgi:hypothetical protein
MQTYHNPLIQNDTIDTLNHVGNVITFLQEYHLASSHPEATQQEGTHSGLFWILRCVNQALECEIAKLEKG